MKEDIQCFLAFVVGLLLFIKQSRQALFEEKAACHEEKDGLAIASKWRFCQPVSELQWVLLPLCMVEFCSGWYPRQKVKQVSQDGLLFRGTVYKWNTKKSSTLPK